MWHTDISTWQSGLSNFGLQVSQSSDRLSDRTCGWRVLTPKVKKNKDKPRGIAMVGFLPVHGGLHKFDIHSTNTG